MLNAIVCGTTFGQVYMKALEKMEGIKLCGILAQGSTRSVKCAERFGVPLYDSVELLPKNIDIAFVVIKSSVLGGKGTEIALELINKKINVMQEHPVHHKDIEKCYVKAKEKGVLYKVGNLYNFLESVKIFIEASKFLNENDCLEYVDVLSSSQGAYSLIGILNYCLPNFRGFEIEKNDGKTKYPFSKIELFNYGVKVNIKLHNEVSDKDGNNHMHLLHRIIIFYESGRLELEDTFGSVVWRARMNIKDTVQPDEKDMDRPMSLQLMGETSFSFRELIDSVFPKASMSEIYGFISDISKNKMNAINAHNEMLISKKWSEIMSEVGYPKNREYRSEYIDHSPALKTLRNKYESK